MYTCIYSRESESDELIRRLFFLFLSWQYFELVCHAPTEITNNRREFFFFFIHFSRLRVSTLAIHTWIYTSFVFSGCAAKGIEKGVKLPTKADGLCILGSSRWVSFFFIRLLCYFFVYAYIAASYSNNFFLPCVFWEIFVYYIKTNIYSFIFAEDFSGNPLFAGKLNFCV